MASLGVRASAAQVIAVVVAERQSLDAALEPALAVVSARDVGLLKALCYGTMRGLHRYQGLLDQLLDRPLKAKDRDIHALLLLGCHQLLDMRVADHAALSTTVEGAGQLGKPWAKSLINGVLRQLQRRLDELLLQLGPAAASSHPEWLYRAILDTWPDQASHILQSNNAHPPLFLRVNRVYHSRDDYLAMLANAGIAGHACDSSDEALVLDEPVAVTKLPGFALGWCSVQDASAQLAAGLLAPKPGQRVLDACSAPGGKACHLLESYPGINLTCLDSDRARLDKVEENLARLNLKANTVAGDARQPDAWWDGELYDAILIDAPCTGLGVIRRNPDIKALRQPSDVARLARLQANILNGLWPCLRPGGAMLYATCSIAPQENNEQVCAFLARHSDARSREISADWGISQSVGRQILPTEKGGDGFFYALISKPLQS